MARKRLTDADWRTIAFALNCAIEERDSFADAYSYTGPEADAAMKNVERFRALHKKLFGKQSAVEDFADEMAKMEQVPIERIMAKPAFGPKEQTP